MIKYCTIPCIAMILFSIVFVSCQEKEKEPVINFPKTNLEASHLIPKPLKTTATYGAFPMNKNTVIYTSNEVKGFTEVGSFLADKIKSKTTLGLLVNPTNTIPKNNTITIKYSDTLSTKNQEAYRLMIFNDSIILNARNATAAFRGIQTLRQLLPEKSNDTLTKDKIWIVPTGTIIDEPQFEYRGTMLDVARHFFEVADVKKYLDILAYYKINTLHLHLSDDQGWRIQIKSWPKLTEVGGKTEVGGGPGGFYTQEEYKDIVSYATARYITIVPEIDMPGHTNAASVSYPILNGAKKKPKPYTGMKVGFSTLDTRKDTVYSFIDDVVREISGITPGPYFHIGGDESHVTKKADYKYFVERVQKIVRKYNKQMVGWDEIATTQIDSTCIPQVWLRKENGQKGIDKKMRVILSPSKKAYLDMKYDSISRHGLNWAGYIPVDVAYKWDPESYYDIKNILGIEAPLWSETITNIEELEYLAFPRIIGYAELGWSIKENRNWEQYKIRLANQVPFLNRMNVKYYQSPLIDWE